MINKEQTILNLKKLKSFHNGSYGADIDRAIKALEQEPCENAISREDALMALTGEWTELTDEIIHHFIKRIKKLPSVNPQPKTGNWIAVENEEMETVGYYCSECDLPMETGKRTDYCPNCGCRMVKPQERSGEE